MAEKSYLESMLWRLNNLYYVVNEVGEKVLFKMNPMQLKLFENYHYMNVIPKARQLGMSTFIDIFGLDATLFNDNFSAGIIAHNLVDAKKLFKTKIKFPYENLPEGLRSKIVATQDSANAYTFSNGSTIDVGTSMRSSTLQFLHISEFGKICSKYPEKAEEIISGSLNTVHPGAVVFIESTAEGTEGYFYEIVRDAELKQEEKRELASLEFKLHFFPWWENPNYVTDHDIQIDENLELYFKKLRDESGVKLTSQQMRWYALKKGQQGEFVYREFPSTLDECFLVSNEGFYYGKQFVKIVQDGRICRVPHDPAVEVNTYWDIGFNDATAIWWIQACGQEIHVIDYYENCNEGLPHYVNLLKHKRDELGYSYSEHWFPHDIEVHELAKGMSRKDTLIKLGIRPKVVPKMGLLDGIDAVRNVLHRCWFDGERCKQGIKALRNYKKVWNDKTATYGTRPLHNWCSNGSDAFRMFAVKSNRLGDRSGSISQEQADAMYHHYGMGS